MDGDRGGGRAGAVRRAGVRGALQAAAGKGASVAGSRVECPRPSKEKTTAAEKAGARGGGACQEDGGGVQGGRAASHGQRGAPYRGRIGLVHSLWARRKPPCQLEHGHPNTKRPALWRQAGASVGRNAQARQRRQVWAGWSQRHGKVYAAARHRRASYSHAQAHPHHPRGTRGTAFTQVSTADSARHGRGAHLPPWHRKDPSRGKQRRAPGHRSERGVRAPGRDWERRGHRTRRGYSWRPRLRRRDATPGNQRIFWWLAHADLAGTGAVHDPGPPAPGRAHEPPGRPRADVAGGVPPAVGEDRGDRESRSRLPQ
mmetsp:Transcript_3671/g.8955  ORF Transcript_3671/g.8955 Transcript_3671/m.8955 type:complete len:314 (+) Transcript_3671:265-1206(+)